MLDVTYEDVVREVHVQQAMGLHTMVDQTKTSMGERREHPAEATQAMIEVRERESMIEIRKESVHNCSEQESLHTKEG